MCIMHYLQFLVEHMSDYFFDYLLVTHVLKRLYPRCFHSLLAHREVAGSNPVTPIFLYSREQWAKQPRLRGYSANAARVEYPAASQVMPRSLLRGIWLSYLLLLYPPAITLLLRYLATFYFPWNPQISKNAKPKHCQALRPSLSILILAVKFPVRPAINPPPACQQFPAIHQGIHDNRHAAPSNDIEHRMLL